MTASRNKRQPIKFLFDKPLIEHCVEAQQRYSHTFKGLPDKQLIKEKEFHALYQRYATIRSHYIAEGYSSAILDSFYALFNDSKLPDLSVDSPDLLAIKSTIFSVLTEMVEIQNLLALDHRDLIAAKSNLEACLNLLPESEDVTVHAQFERATQNSSSSSSSSSASALQAADLKTEEKSVAVAAPIVVPSISSPVKTTLKKRKAAALDNETKPVKPEVDEEKPKAKKVKLHANSAALFNSEAKSQPNNDTKKLSLTPNHLPRADKIIPT